MNEPCTRGFWSTAQPRTEGNLRMTSKNSKLMAQDHKMKQEQKIG